MCGSLLKMDKRGTRAKALGEKGGRDRKAKGIWEGGEGGSSGSQGRVGEWGHDSRIP